MVLTRQLSDIIVIMHKKISISLRDVMTWTGLGRCMMHVCVTQHGWAGEALTLEAGQVIHGLLNLLQGLLNTQCTQVQLVCVADVCIPA